MSPQMLAMLSDIATQGKQFWRPFGSPLGVLLVYPKVEMRWHNERMKEIHDRK